MLRLAAEVSVGSECAEAVNIRLLFHKHESVRYGGSENVGVEQHDYSDDRTQGN
jgi:hypothetical protein